MTEIVMTKTDAKIYDLEKRTLAFAKRVRLFIKNLLISSGKVGAIRIVL